MFLYCLIPHSGAKEGEISANRLLEYGSRKGVAVSQLEACGHPVRQQRVGILDAPGRTDAGVVDANLNLDRTLDLINEIPAQI